MMRILSRSFASLVLLTTVLGACSKDPPDDCGDSSMAIVTFFGRSQDEDENQRVCIDIHAASRPDATATSRGRDESFATSRPNAIPWTNLTFEEAIYACANAGKFLCNFDELAGITPVTEGLGRAVFDETAIEALSPTSAVTEVAHRFDPLNRYDMVIRAETGKPPFPESTGSVAFWSVSPEAYDKERDPNIPMMVGRLEGDRAIGGYVVPTEVLDPDYKHPLLGFRCCIHTRLRGVFEELPRDPAKVREREDEEVPLAR